MTKTIKTTTIDQIDDYSGVLTGDQSMIISDPESSSTKKVSLTNLKTFFGATSGYGSESTDQTQYSGINVFKTNQYGLYKDVSSFKDTTISSNGYQTFATDNYEAVGDVEELYIHVNVELSSLSDAFSFSDAYLGIQIQMNNTSKTEEREWITICRKSISDIGKAKVLRSMDQHICLQGGMKIRAYIYGGNQSVNTNGVSQWFVNTKPTALYITTISDKIIPDKCSISYIYIDPGTQYGQENKTFTPTTPLSDYEEFYIEGYALGKSDVANQLNLKVGLNEDEPNMIIGKTCDYAASKDVGEVFLGRFYFKNTINQIKMNFSLDSKLTKSTGVYVKIKYQGLNSGKIKEIKDNTINNSKSLMIKSTDLFCFQNISVIDNEDVGVAIKCDENKDGYKEIYAEYDNNTIESRRFNPGVERTLYFEDKFTNFSTLTSNSTEYRDNTKTSTYNYRNYITDIRFNGNYTNPVKSAFANLTALKSVDFSQAQTTEIDDNAFNGCLSLSSVTFNDKLKKVGVKAFQNCKALSSIVLPMNTLSIDDNAFIGCSSLTSIVIPYTISSVASTFINDNNYTLKRGGKLWIATDDLLSTQSLIGNYINTNESCKKMIQSLYINDLKKGVDMYLYVCDIEGNPRYYVEDSGTKYYIRIHMQVANGNPTIDISERYNI